MKENNNGDHRDHHYQKRSTMGSSSTTGLQNFYGTGSSNVLCALACVIGTINIKKIVIAIGLLSIMTLLSAITPVLAPGVTQVRWTPGWDEFNHSLNFATSKVIFIHPDSSSNLIINYNLHGAAPNTAYGVGIHLLWGSTMQCVNSFGQFAHYNCDIATRQGKTRAFEPFELGTITTDSLGDGSLGVIVSGITPGTYEMEFRVRTMCAGSPFCNVIFQSPGPTYGAPGSTVFVTIP
jgi:hypothetical protein